jgi:hypothetical protein
LTAYAVLPGDRLFDTIAPGRREPPGNLTPALGASGPHGFAVRIGAARLATPTRPPQPAPTSVTWPTPPLAGQDARHKPVIWGEKIREYFFVWDWTGQANHFHSLREGSRHTEVRALSCVRLEGWAAHTFSFSRHDFARGFQFRSRPFQTRRLTRSAAGFLFPARGQRSPREATCPRIAS